jgi:sugar transferase (PEP-CTERM/EpsH1 system associated)
MWKKPDKHKVNVMFIINGLGIGGAERNLVEMLRNYRSDRYNPIVCSVGQGGPFQEVLEAHNIPVYVFYKKHPFDVSLVFKVAKLMRRYRCKIAVTILFYADIIGSLAAWLARVPVCIMWSAGTIGKGSKNDGRRHRLSYKLVRHLVKYVISVSRKTAQFLVKERSIPANKIKILHYGVDINNFAPMSEHERKKKRAELGYTDQHFLVAEIGRLTEQKGHIYLIRAAVSLVRKHPNLRFLIIGDGPLRESLKEEVRRQGLETFFNFLGARKDIRELLNAIDLMVLPSLWEGLPNIILEAMACGTPIVATAVDGTPEAVVDGETGILIPPRDPDALARAIDHLIGNRELLKKMGRNARMRAIEEFSIGKQIERFNALFDLSLSTNGVANSVEEEGAKLAGSVAKKAKELIPLLLAFLLSGLSSDAVAQHPNHTRFPKLSIQQTWIERTQPSIIEIMSRYDLIQAGLSREQIQEIRRRNPNAIILAFDSFAWDYANRGKMVPEWLDNTGRPDVSDDCPVYQFDKILRGVNLKGLIYQDWKVLVCLQYRDKGFDGVYIDHWDNPWWGDTDRYTVEEFKQGMSHIAEKFRQKWPGLILLGNPATDIHFSYQLNGFMWEDYPVFSGSFDKVLQTVEEWEAQGAEPHILIINQRTKDNKAVTDKQNKIAGFWERMRYATTMSMMANSLYLMFDYGNGGSPHWANSWWFDEWSVDIGQPVGKAQKLPNGVYYRQFTNGIVLCNTTARPQTIKASDLPGGPYYRFLGGQRPDFNNGKLFTEVTLDGWSRNNQTSGQWAKPIGDGIILVKTPQTVVSDIIIDDEGNAGQVLENNIQGEFTQSGFSFDPEAYGRWAEAWRVYGHNTCYYASPGDGSSWARWTPRIGVAGYYDVYEWHPSGADHASNAPFTIRSASGDTVIYVNQRVNGAQWNYLGRYYFQVGTAGYVEVRNQADGIVLADAVKFVFAGTDPNADREAPMPPRGVRVRKK